MKKNISILLILVVSCFVFIYGQDVSSSAEESSGDNAIVTPDILVEEMWGTNPLDLVEFNDNVEFTIGEDSQSYSSIRDIKPFAINKFETTYGLWHMVRELAKDLGYNIENAGQAGNVGKNSKAPTEETNGYPVSMITWYDAIIWCNAYSELSGRTPCYTFEGAVLKDSSDKALCDLSSCDWNADGFRLPSEAEWEYAAKRNKDSFQPGDKISGQCTEDDNGLFYAWSFENSDSSKVVGTAGTLFDENSIALMGTGNANCSGIFDMSGNVLEYCWDWFEKYYSDNANYGPEFGFERVSRGGSWSEYTMFLFVEDRYRYDPNICYDYMGFRVCCSLTD